MGIVFAAGVQLETQTCWNCGGVYALTEHFLDKRRERGGSWHCPYCDKSTVFRETDVQKLQKQLDAQVAATVRERQQHDQTKAELKNTENVLRSTRAAKTRLRNRVSKGVCPCCNRYFANVHQHIERQHPQFKTEA